MPTKPRMTKFEINGLFGSRDISLPIEGNVLILVGPNGIGKSHVLNIFCFFISRQWMRLQEYQFSELKLHFSNSGAEKEDVLTLRYSDLRLLSVFSQILFKRSRFLSSSMLEKIRILAQKVELLEFIFMKEDDTPAKQKFAKILEMEEQELSILQRRIKEMSILDEEILEPEDAHRVSNIERELRERIPQRVVYLPTYRMIERNIGVLIPHLEREGYDVQERDDDDDLRYISKRRWGLRKEIRANNDKFVELVHFGMTEVNKGIKNKTDQIKDFASAEFQALASRYLEGLLQKRGADTVGADVNEGDAKNALDRIDNSILSKSSKDALLKIIQDKKERNTPKNKIIYYYFSLLLAARDSLSRRENSLQEFAAICNNYLEPRKHMIYDEKRFEIGIKDNQDNNIELEQLSSGEKQVVALFSHLYLDELKKGESSELVKDGSQEQGVEGELIIIIDEPELSLSVPWQKNFCLIF